MKRPQKGCWQIYASSTASEGQGYSEAAFSGLAAVLVGPEDCCPPAGVSAAAVWVVETAAGFSSFGWTGVGVAAPAVEGFG